MENNLIGYSLQSSIYPENFNFYPLNDDSYYLELKSQSCYNPTFQPRVLDYNQAQFYYPNESYFGNYPTIQEEVKSDENVVIKPLREKFKRKRTKFTKDQLQMLEESFLEHDYIPKLKRMQLAKTLGLPDVQVKIWFQNRRCKNKKGKKVKKIAINQQILSENFSENQVVIGTNDEKSFEFNESLNFSPDSIIYPEFF